MKKYGLRYLPLAAQDLNKIVDYIRIALRNPEAAENTLSKIEKAILAAQKNPEAFAVRRTQKKRARPYRRVSAGNYSVWYVVIGDVVEIRRILYSGRDGENLLT